MSSPTTEREQALRWLMANRRQDVSIEQAVRLMCTVLPRDLVTMQLLQRIAEEEQAQQSDARTLNWRTPRGMPPRG
ncbi:hypothetical protein [Accumulibacter sp.]|uniref:hypothetical protein n=1 Tax=Accumulibacter sp. TaxID=2053492 RepID=UPI0025E85A38|nr:hypothetical protein [Accumulibacter sp.]MCM8595164.1 hypothetical protein [Accumulibacter sp.]MCM8625617.1 hypothetical protein [Accumulibacter sp.]MDS4049310.1 hypothetical protein [Accumulibacter sp.]